MALFSGNLCWLFVGEEGRWLFPVAGTIFLLPLAVGQGLLNKTLGYGFEAWASILYLSVFGTVVGFLWYYQSINEIGAVRSGVFINFVPIFAMLFGLLLLGEPLTATLLQGGALVLAGAWITNNNGLWRKKEHS